MRGKFLYWAVWQSGTCKHLSLKHTHTHTHGDTQLKENEDEVGHSTTEFAVRRTRCKFSETDSPF